MKISYHVLFSVAFLVRETSSSDLSPAVYLHTDGAANADNDALMVVVDGNEERRLGDVDMEGSENDLIVTATDRLFQSGQVTSAARVADNDGQIFAAVVHRRRRRSRATTTASEQKRDLVNQLIFYLTTAAAAAARRVCFLLLTSDEIIHR